MSDATVKLMDITSDMSSALRAGANDGQMMQRNGKEQRMKCGNCGWVEWFTLKYGIPYCLYCGRKLRVRMKGADDEV